MGIFGKRKTTDADIKENKYQIESMTGSIEALKVITTNEDVLNKLNVVQEKIKYMNPTNNKTALSLDKKILDVIGDIKIALIKIKTEDDIAKILADLVHLEMLIADRNNNSRSIGNN